MGSFYETELEVWTALGLMDSLDLMNFLFFYNF